MANGDDKPAGGRPETGGARRRGAAKPATIDLEATPVEETPSPEEEAQVSASEATDGEAGAGDEVQAESSPSGDNADDPTPAPAEIDGDSAGGNGQKPSRIPGFMIAGFIGAVAGVALFLTLQFSEILPGYGDDVSTFQTQFQDASQQLDAMRERLATLEESAAAPPDDGLSERIAAIEAQVSETGGDGDAAPLDLSPLETRLSELEARLSDLDSTVSDLPAGGEARSAQNVAALERRVEEQAEALRGLGEEVAGELSAMRDTLQQRETAADREIARAAAAALALASLTRAVHEGRPYAAELAALEPLVGQNEDLSRLAANAEDGLITAGALSAEFSEVSDEILSAGEEATGGMAARIAANARSLVRVRPSGPVEGDSRSAILSRIEAALERDNLRQAYREWQSLDEAARIASTQWADDLRRRVSAEAELTRLASAISGVLGAPAPAD